MEIKIINEKAQIILLFFVKKRIFTFQKNLC